jgi:hypothetical protein
MRTIWSMVALVPAFVVVAVSPDKAWNAYERTKPQKLNGVTKTTRFNRDSYGVATLEADGKTWTAVLASPVRMDFRGLTEEMLKPGVVVTIEGFDEKAA